MCAFQSVSMTIPAYFMGIIYQPSTFNAFSSCDSAKPPHASVSFGA